MSDASDLQFMPLDDLAQRCAQETKLYFKKLVHDTKYCFELFRRAISDRSDHAWKALILQYKPSVARWVNRWADKHPNFPLTREEEEDFIEESFIRFWRHFTPEKLQKSGDLNRVLQYLKMCVNSTISDIWRKMQHLQFEQKSDTEDDDDDDDDPNSAQPGPTSEESIQNDELWKAIKVRLKDEKEHTIVYASFFLALSPREILSEFPGMFNSIEELYQCKANVLARLERDQDLRDLFK